VYGFDSKRFTSYLKKNFLNYQNLKSFYNSEYDRYNNVYSLNLIQEYLNDDCIILFGDNIIKPNTFKTFQSTDETQVFINSKIKTRLGCIIQNNTIYNISYDLDNYLSEIYFIPKNQIDIFKKLISNPINHNHFIFEIINKMIDLNLRITPCQQSI
jgi:choline kinase